MAEPNFVRTSSVDLLYYLDPVAGPGSYAVGFLPADGESPPNVLPLGETWRNIAGIYIFLPAPPADSQTFVTNLRQYLGGTTPRFLWLNNPDAPINLWQTRRIDVTKPTPGDVGTLTINAPVQLGNYLLVMEKNCTIGLAPGFESFTIDKIPAVPDSITLEFTQIPDRLEIAGGVTIPFTGTSVGCLRFDLPVQDHGATSDLDTLNAGLRYFFENHEIPVPGLLDSLRYPVLSLANGPLVLHGSFDPIHPFDRDRTCFAFLSDPPVPAMPIASAFRSVYGEKISLMPAVSVISPKGPRLVFSVRPGTVTPGPEEPYYLTYDGSFTIQIESPVGGRAATDPEGRIMCGASGLEYAGLMNAIGATLHFSAGHPAFAPVLPGDEPPPDDAPLLTDLATTSWLCITPPGGSSVRYFAQPRDSTLYKAESAAELAGTGLNEDLLYYLEVFAGTFPDVPVPPQAGASTFFPMVPYTMTDPARIDALRMLESNILSPMRRALLETILEPTGPCTETQPDTVQGTTPQGLLFTFDEELKCWKALTLALVHHASGDQLLQLENITGGFKGALQSDQLFAVISNRDEFLRCCQVLAPFALTIDGWDFQLGPGNWEAQKTIVLFKYTNRSIEELAADTSLWSWKEAANGHADGQGNLATTQAELLAFIDDARERAATSSDFRFFYEEIVANRNWSGVVFLRVQLDTDVFPEELQGLAAGIDPAKFYAHHIGITATPVRNNGGVLEQDESSIFGLINYDDPDDLFFDGADYGYKVLSLKVLYQNSMVSNFFSQIELMVNSLFGDRSVIADGNRGNNLILDGSYQRTGGTPSYSFAKTDRSLFNISGAVLEGLEVDGATFTTLLPANQELLGGDIRTRFVLSGTLRFRALEAFDLFSFGNLRAGDGTTEFTGGLYCSNLIIGMEFPADQPTMKRFTFDAGVLAFDMSKSTARPDGLFNHFPLQLNGLVQAPADTTTSDMGYIPINSPLQRSTLSSPWYALAFVLELGTLGALAGGAGLVVTMMAAWAPGEGEPRVFLGLKLPGTQAAGSPISLQGVLKLAYKAIELTVNPGAEGIEYILRFRSIGLKLLSLTFPPGQIDLYLFGDPSGGRSGTLGWYAAYAKSA